MPSHPVTLAIDVGNSRVKYALFEPTPTAHGDWPNCFQFLATTLTTPLPTDQMRDWFDTGKVRCVAAASNPPVLERLLADWPTSWPPLAVVRSGLTIPIGMSVDFPEKVGLDRLLNGVAANRLRRPDQAAIVIDSGTATTVDLIDAGGTFAGGAILPGFDLSAKALHQYTALLPHLTRTELGETQPSPLGKNTRDALRSGLYWGQIGAIRELVARLTDLVAPTSSSAPLVLLTGGGAPLLHEHFPSAQWETCLGLQGLALTHWHAEPKTRQ